MDFENFVNEKYNSLSYEEKERLYSLYFNKEASDSLKEKAEKLLFFKRPPTPEEFIDPSFGWLPENVVKGTFDHIKQEFCDIINKSQKDKISRVVQYGSTRQGKSYLSRLIILYTIVFIHHLREPSMYYKLSPLTDLCIYLISFKFDKTRQLYLEPMFKIMRKSKKFKQVKFQDQVRTMQESLGRDTIVWSKASESGEITLASGLQIHMGNDDALSFIGGDVLQAYISEIAYFVENAGATEEDIYRLYTDITTRIKNTVGKGFLAFTYLDTSANNAESLIENHIINELQVREGVHFNWKSLWEARPNLFPIWQETGKTFKVFVGSSGHPAKIIENDQEITINMTPDKLIDVPIDAYETFKDNLIRQIKDMAGRPTILENKFINNTSVIESLFDNPVLHNVEGIVHADASIQPENLLWDQLHNQFFFKLPQEAYQIKRAPHELRYIGLDNAFSLKGDVMGLCMLHKEWSQKQKQTVFVVDFCFPISAKETAINLDAPACFIVDMIRYAGVRVHGLFTDTFHSESQKQFLERNRVSLTKNSVDEEINPYQYLLTCLINGKIKSGKNVFIKNNFFSLVHVKSKSGREKIDHIKGTTNNNYLGDYANSKCGINAKDTTDALCQALWGAYSHDTIPSTVYEEENAKFSTDEKVVTDRVSEMYNKLHKMY